MPIDWFTVIAQIINFLILLWLLKRFLYKPIIDGLNARETKIEKILNEANDKKEKAEALQIEYQSKLDQIEQQRLGIINKSKEDAQKQRNKLYQEAQLELEVMRNKRLQGITQEVQDLQQGIVQKSLQEVYATCNKVFIDLADKSLQDLMFNKLIEQLAKAKQNLSLPKTNDLSENQIEIQSTFEISSEQRSTLEAWFNKQYQSDKFETLSFNYKINPDLICGVELVFNGWKVPWSTHNYLNQMRAHLTNNSPLLASQSGLTNRSVNHNLEINSSESNSVENDSSEKQQLGNN